jgi:hypothetical protein
MKFSLKNLNFLFLTLGLTSYASPVFAYLDPGTGSILLQGLIGGVAITMSFLSIYWQKVKAFFVKKELDSDTEEDIGNND